MSKLILVANRLPVKVKEDKGELEYKPSEGGLATGLSSLEEPKERLWIGWPGIINNDKDKQEQIKADLAKRQMRPIFLSDEAYRNYYEGFSNETLWPLFHYFIENTKYDKEFWQYYYQVNQEFCREVLKHYEEGDTIWIHDYHLMLLPSLIREHLPGAKMGFFLHIPFPSYEVYRLLPWRKALLNGLLGADLIGFHTSSYMRHFSSSVYRLLGIEQHLGSFQLNEHRLVRVDAFPMGIDFKKFNEKVKTSEARKEAETYRSKFGSLDLILSVDRLDYSKGILQRLKAFEYLLQQNPEYQGNISLVLVVVPSREVVDEYKELKEEIDEMVGYVNGNYGGLDWLPIHYFYRSLDFLSLLSLYSIAKVGLVTPFRDGMNLIAKEFIASKADCEGVLVLSEMAGAGAELSEALIINPNDLEQVANAIDQALKMPLAEQRRRNRIMQEKLETYDIANWAHDFINRLEESQVAQVELFRKYLGNSAREELLTDFQESNDRLIVLDLDGTLMPVSENPADSRPDIHLVNTLDHLGRDPANTIVITSGRDRQTLEEWFGNLNVDIVGEHGAWIRKNEKRWISEQSQKQDWKGKIYDLLNEYTVKTPGSFIEEKEFSLVWHYRKSDAWLAEIRLRNLSDDLYNRIKDTDLQVMEGNKVIEVKNAGVNKGRGVTNWLEDRDWDFVMAIGDDKTDEDTFKLLPEKAYTIKVGFKDVSSAKYNFRYPSEVRDLLTDFLKEYHAMKKVEGE